MTSRGRRAPRRFNVYAWTNDCWGSGNSDQFVSNTCIANSDTGGFKSDCEKVSFGGQGF